MRRYLLFALYGGFNLIYLRIVFFVLLYTETYLNGFLIPQSFLWNENGTKREQPVIWGVLEDGLLLVIESALLLLLIYYINKLYLKMVVRTGNAKSASMWTGGIFFLIVLIFLASLKFGFYFPLVF